MRTVTTEVSPKDRVHNVVEKILNTRSGSDQDMNATCQGKVLKGSAQLERCGVRDGSTVQVGCQQAAKEEQRCAGETKSNKGPAIRECDKDAVEEMEGYRKVIECGSEGSDIELDRSCNST